MKKMLLLLGILLLTTSLFAQEKETVFNYSGLKLTGLWGGPALGLSGVGEENSPFRGGFFGLEFNKSFYAGYAAYWLNEKAELPQFTDQKLDFGYKGLQLGYALNSGRLVHPKFSVLFAGGNVELDDDEADNVFVMQPGLGVEINVFKWFHIDVLGGYRLVSGTDIEGLSDMDISAPFGEIRLRFGISWGWE